MGLLSYIVSVNGMLVIISLLFHLFPPKKSNSFYGYKTYRTQQNQKIWDDANSYFNKILLKYSIVSFLVAVALVFVNPNFMNSWFPMGILFFTVLVCIISTEQYLNKYYDKEGKPKK